MKKLRQEFADTLMEVGQADPRLVVMVGDISHGILQPYARACPGRYYNVGICEPTIVNMAAGIFKSGLIPVVHTIAPFIIERAYEQIKLDFGYQNYGINLISVGSAFDYSQLGCSHHCYTDLSLMSHFKRSNVFFPASPVEFNTLFKTVYRNGQINYFRLSDIPHGIAFSADQIRVGQGIRIREGKDLTIVVIGPPAKWVLEAAETLASRGVETDVLYLHTIKPFDDKLVRRSVEKTRAVLTVEEASAHDGIFNRVLRATAGLNDVRHGQIAIEDFVHGYGSYEELAARVGIHTEGILAKIQESFPSLGINRREDNPTVRHL